MILDQTPVMAAWRCDVVRVRRSNHPPALRVALSIAVISAPCSLAVSRACGIDLNTRDFRQQFGEDIFLRRFELVNAPARHADFRRVPVRSGLLTQRDQWYAVRYGSIADRKRGGRLNITVKRAKCPPPETKTRTRSAMFACLVEGKRRRPATSVKLSRSADRNRGRKPSDPCADHQDQDFIARRFELTSPAELPRIEELKPRRDRDPRVEKTKRAESILARPTERRR